MEIERVDVYEDGRFSQKVLYQHGCFLVRGAPYEVEIVSAVSAVVRGSDQSVFPQLIDEFRFYTPYITRFFDEQGKLLAAYQPVQRFPVSLSQLQPSQFYVDRDKVTAIATFVRSWEDIVISVLPMGERYIALDGHTRLYYAVSKHWDQVYAVCHTVDDSIYDFVREAKRRGITSPQDLELLEHEEYDSKWNHYCDNYFSGKFT